MAQLHIDLGLPEYFGDIRQETVENLQRTSNMVLTLCSRLFRGFGITQAQFNVLLVLKGKEKDVTQTELGDRLGITRASVTSVLDRLEAKGLIARNSVPGDRRIYHVALKAAGLALVEKVEREYRKMIGSVTGSLNEEECRVVLRCLERMRESAADVSNEEHGAE